MRALLRPVAVLTLALTTLAACAGDDASTAPEMPEPTPSPNPPSSSAYVVTGRVTNADGAPIAGATVVANNQYYYSASVSGTSGADGSYRLQLSDTPGTWSVSASIVRTFDGTQYRIALAPDSAGPFAGPTGAVRSFVWHTRGRRADGGYYGKPVIAYPALEEGNYDLVMTDVELTLTPVAMLDGTAGQVITGRLVATADGDAIRDVPIGRYTITAREARAGEPPRPLHVRLRNQGSYVPALTTGFVTPYGTNLDIAQIVLQVRR